MPGLEALLAKWEAFRGDVAGDCHLARRVGDGARDVAVPRRAQREAEVRGFVMQRLRRDVGVMAAREMARHRLTRLACVGVPRHILEQRQQQRFGTGGRPSWRPDGGVRSGRGPEMRARAAENFYVQWAF